MTKKYPWIVVGLLWFVALLNYMDRQMLSTMKPAMQVDIAELQSAASFGYDKRTSITGVMRDRKFEQ